MKGWYKALEHPFRPAPAVHRPPGTAQAHDQRQAAAEFIVERLDQFVHDNMGYHFDKYIPLIGSIFALSIGCNLISVIGLWSPTADLNTEAAWAIVVFVLIL